MMLDSKVSFICNICGAHVECSRQMIDREKASCSSCRSTVRMRSIAYLFSKYVIGEAAILTNLKSNKKIKGVGLSDSLGYAKILSKKFDYTNTFFHKKPFLDIANPPEDLFACYDFIISSDVFEHVPPPSSTAFEGAFNLLKPGGFLILTVPFTNKDTTTEHFPNLKEYEVLKFNQDEYVLVNRKSDGEFEVYKDLVFHGGPGTTLEMRVFCRNDLNAQLSNAGFENVVFSDTDVLEYGIIHNVNWSLPIAAMKPR